MPILQNVRFRVLACLAWCFCWPLIAILLLMPLPFAMVSRSDLLGHFLLFALMAFSVIAFTRKRAQVFALAALSIGYGIALECGQAFVPGRTFDVADVAANILGGVTGCLLALALLSRWVRKPASETISATPAGRSSRS